MPDPSLSYKCINWHARERFVNWVAYVHYSCNLAPEILFRAINLMDRYLAKSDCPLQGAQWDALAAASLWSSWKFDGAEYPIIPLDTILNYTQPGMISRTDVIYAEWTLHRILEHDISFPGPLVFMRRALLAFDSLKEVAYITRFFVEISLTAKSMALCRPSGTAAAAVWLARELMDIPTWVSVFSHSI
ncbi:hypothetical protein BDV93DRAFT_456654 [Ceratobasidium sp. AG-I]|nr:hypothetical protein BDV93DRAFT_456654 [Ceratobasidium sp. AG-I]